LDDIYLHKSVLLDEVVEFVAPKPGGVYVDATLGAGGHAEKILESTSPDGVLIGMDLDAGMLEIAKRRLEKFGNRCGFFESNFCEIKNVLDICAIKAVDGILLDLGVSMYHFFDAEKGFSFSKDGPLDMRLSRKGKVSAYDIVNKWDQEKIAEIVYKYGEEKMAGRIARRIIEERNKKNIGTTGELARIVSSAAGGKRGGIHPATKTFQALRIAVNDELNNLKSVLPAAVSLLKTGGRLCVISFHSLEDRIVKEQFRCFSNPCECPSDFIRCVCGKKPEIKIITKKPVCPGEAETVVNPSARSAKLRVVEKI